jgi:hypothetical protein
MKILTHINQNESIRRGIDAPSSTAKIEVNLAQLSEEERAFIATHFENGGLDKITSYGKTRYLKAKAPTVDALMEAVTEAIAWTKKCAADRETEIVAQKAWELKNAQENMASPPMTAYLDEKNRLYPYPWRYVTLMVGESLLEEPFRTEYLEWEAADKLALKQGREAAVAKQKHDQEQAAKKTKAEYDACLAKLPRVLKDRVAAGYGNPDEIDTAIRNLIIEEYGFSSVDHHARYDKDVVLTDDEFAAFVKSKEDLQKRFPGATIRAVKLRLAGVQTEYLSSMCEFEHAGISITGFKRFLVFNTDVLP